MCEKHHLECEQTIIPVEDVRLACGITKKIMPPHLYDDHIYDKWGNPVAEDGTRAKGELFSDGSVQKVLAQGDKLRLFSSRVKYPRTYHLPWSPGVNDDDRILWDVSHLAQPGTEIVITLKMDGENTTMYSDYIHARSLDSRNHESRNWVKNFWSKISGDIPEGWRVCGENLYAKHSIYYGSLRSYFYGFSIWDERNVCLGWDQTLEWFHLLGIHPVPVLYRGPYDELKIQKLWGSAATLGQEGYVVRRADEIPYGEFRIKVGKFVRKDHVQTVKHWMHGQRIEPNKIVPEDNTG